MSMYYLCEATPPKYAVWSVVALRCKCMAQILQK